MLITLLIVEDNKVIRSAFEKIICNFGIKTLSVSDGKEAIDILKHHHVDIILLDVGLPDISGIDLTHIIRKNYNVKIILTSHSNIDKVYSNATDIDDFIAKPINRFELEFRLRKLITLYKKEKEARDFVDHLHRLSIVDELTGLYNVRQFNINLTNEILRCQRYHKNNPPSLIFIDIDDFKVFNDTYGHVEGDKVLSEVGKRIKCHLRNVDSAYRYGGEEFTIILPETDVYKAYRVAERLQSSIQNLEFFPNNEKINVTVSIGVTQFKNSERQLEFIDRADKAMYMSKKSGKNKVTKL